MRTFGHDGRQWIAYFHFVGWDCISLGVSVCFSAPNLELHLPFGFVRVGKNSKAMHYVLEDKNLQQW